MQPACRWIATEDSAFLHWHYACIATVKADGDGFETVISWCDREHRGRAGSMAQGMRFVERWVSVQKGLPRHRKGR